jgi:hypothetical protein
MKYFILLLSFICSLSFAQVSNETVIPFESGQQTAATVNSIGFPSNNHKGGHFVINVTTATSGTYTPHIQGKDPISGTYYDVLVGPAISTTGTTILKIYPGINAIANGASSDILPSVWRIQLIGASTPNMALSVAAYLLN